MERLFRLIGRTRQNFHKGLAAVKRKKEREAQIIARVQDYRADHPKMGGRTLFHSLCSSGTKVPVGISAFEKLLSRKGLTVKKVRRSVPRTSDGKGNRSFPNLANGLALNGINQLTVADITYIWVGARWYYLFILKDVYSQRLVSLLPSRDMKALNAVRTLKDLEKLRGRPSLKACIHHSDNGSQYDSTAFLEKLNGLGMKVSRAENCKQNGSCEQMNHIIKNMYLGHYGLRDFEGLVRACKKVKRLMNEERTIGQLGNRTVRQFEDHIKTLCPEDRPVKELHDFAIWT